ncbi:MAG TPA: nitrilase-related carbon-nitrogen hydrolase [Planctomycetota bacterium]|nr:nitrilase-related carbon-nitrogen hydrolase [Planctomycetota bacterium]
MRIAFVQFDVKFGDPEWNAGKPADLLASARADLAVLPELSTSGYVFTSKQELESLAEPVDGGPSVESWKRLAARRNMHIVAGLAERDGDRIFNSAVLVSPGGKVDVYRKVHLFHEEKEWFSPGDTGFNVFDIGTARLGMMVCFDWFFPEACRTLALRGADIICQPANLVLPYCQDAMVTRCVENRVFSITANRYGIERRGGRQMVFTGRSRIINPLGQVLAEGPPKADSVQVVEINPADARNKSLGEHNHLFNDRRPEFYEH